MENQEHDVYDLGLSADLQMMKRTPIQRRRILKMGLAGIGLLLVGHEALAAQTEATTSAYLPLVMKSGATNTPTTTATSASTSPTATTAVPTATATSTTCVSEIPEETNGPYPADGSNASNQSINVLTRSGIVRSDIRTSTSVSNGGTAAGVPFTFTFTLVDSNSNCAPLVGYAVYVWHCNRDGNYSLYSSGVTNEDYLRGVQATDSSGKVTFTSIFPACYSGRWPHVHFEVYPSLEKATGPSNLIHTSQMAMPEDVCKTVYATTGYSQSVTNLSRVTLASDNVFSDGYSLQLPTVSGDVTNGYNAQLTVGVNV